MYLQLDLISLCIYFTQIILVTSFKTRIGHFKVSRRSSEIKECLSKHLSKSDFNGLLRVNTPDGKCETLSSLWHEESIEPGYDYAKLTTIKQRFNPPKSIQHKGGVIINWPAAITTWTRFSVYVTWPSETWDVIWVSLYGRLDSHPYNIGITLQIHDSIHSMWISEQNSKARTVEYKDELPGTKCNVTFDLTGIQDIKFQFNGKTMGTWEGKQVMHGLEKINIFYRGKNPWTGLSFLIHGFDIIQG